MARPKANGRSALTIEEVSLLIVGIIFGYFVGRGMSALLLAVPIAILAIFLIRHLERRM